MKRREFIGAIAGAAKELPAERAIVPRNESAVSGVGRWLSRHHDLTLDRRKRGHAFQPGMAW